MTYISSLNSSSSHKLDSAESDIVYGGFTSKESLHVELDLLRDRSPQKILQKLHIKDSNLEKAQLKPSWSPSHTMTSSGPPVIWTRSANYQPPRLSHYIFFEPKFAIALTHDKQDILYGLPLSYHSEALQEAALVGKDAFGQEFALLKKSGNIITTWNTAQKVSFCYKSPESLSLSHQHCPNSPSFSKYIQAKNLTFNTDAHILKAKPNDHIQYTLSIENSGESTAYTPYLYVDDILEYADLENYHGALFDGQRGLLIWNEQNVTRGQKVSLSFSVKIKDKISLKHQNNNNARSYDCRLSTHFGILYSIDVVCPPPKVIERLVTGRSHSQYVLYGALAILIVNSLLILYSNVRLRHMTQQIASIRRKVAP